MNFSTPPTRQKAILFIVKWILLLTMVLPSFAIVLHTYGILFKYKAQRMDFELPYKNKSDGVFELNRENVAAIDKLDNYKMNLSIKNFSFSIYDEIGRGEALLFHVPIMLVYILIIYQMYLLVRSAEEGNFFISANVKRLNRLGFGFLLLSLHSYVSDRIGMFYYNKFVLGKEWLTNMSINFLPKVFDSFFFTALIIFVLAQAFKQGVNLKEEQELTI